MLAKVLSAPAPPWSPVSCASREYLAYAAALRRMDEAPTIVALEDRIGEVEDALEGLHLALCAGDRGRRA